MAGVLSILIKKSNQVSVSGSVHQNKIPNKHHLRIIATHSSTTKCFYLTFYT